MGDAIDDEFAKEIHAAERDTIRMMLSRYYRVHEQFGSRRSQKETAAELRDLARWLNGEAHRLDKRVFP